MQPLQHDAPDEEGKADDAGIKDDFCEYEMLDTSEIYYNEMMVRLRDFKRRIGKA